MTPEEIGEKGEAEKAPKILVCNTIHEWSSPASHPHIKCLHVEDLETGKNYSTQCSPAELASFLSKGFFGIHLDKNEEPVYDPIRLGYRGYTVYGDGYFGRPLIPCSFHSLHALTRRQIEEFKRGLSEQQTEDKQAET